MEAEQLVHKIATKEEVKSFLIQVLEAFQNMDYHKLNDLLDEEAYYEDMKKTAFIYKQMEIFKELRKKGDTNILISTNICTGCLCSEPIFVLTGNVSGATYAIYIKFMDDEIVDIYRCSQHSRGLNLMPF